MTQAQLRAFIPLMLKFSTGKEKSIFNVDIEIFAITFCVVVVVVGRGKPGWGKESTRPPWWPGEVPWANVRMDARPEDDKQRVINNYIVFHFILG